MIKLTNIFIILCVCVMGALSKFQVYNIVILTINYHAVH